MYFVREDIPSKLLPNLNPSGNIENIFIEINLRSKKRLILGFYNPHVGLMQNHTVNLSKNLDFYSSRYENFIVIGDLAVKRLIIAWKNFVRHTILRIW